jgi:CubicO group peptidase (beta-lactamase class C family)
MLSPILALAFAVSNPVVGQEHSLDFSALEQTARDELRELNTPGAAIGIVSGDRLIFAKGIGISNIETGAAVTPEMLFRIASVTKMFTAAAVVTLASQGHVKLDEPIGRIVNGLHPSLARLTPHQLLSHTSGLLDEHPFNGNQDDGALAAEVLSWKESRFVTHPDEIYSYSNPGYWLLGFVVGELTGKACADAMRQLVFTPLGMTRTMFRPTLAMTYPLALGHHVNPGKPPVLLRPLANNAAFYPAESMFSNVYDLSRFAIAFMNGGRLEGVQVLSPDVIAKMSTGYVKIPGPGGLEYGYGSVMREYRGFREVYHAGTRPGYGSFIWMVPDQRFAVMVLANRTGAHLIKTGYKAMDIVLKLEPESPREQATELPITDADTRLWAGTYEVSPDQHIEVFSRNGKLFLRRDKAELPIRKTGENRFSSIPPLASRGDYLIVRGRDGRTLYLTNAGVGGRAAKKLAGG